MKGLKSKNRILLTGAGFSKNFGAFLAKEMLDEIYNNDLVEKSPKLRKLLLDTGDFEVVYSKVLTSDEFTLEEKEIIKKAVEGAYKNLDSAIKGIRFDDSNPIGDWGSFVASNFSGDGHGVGLFFTLNQDLILERNYGNKCPGVPSFQGLNHVSDFSNNDFIELSQTIERAKEDILGINLSYIKLHGSYGWKSSDGSNQMVVGKNKSELIEKEPILKLYFDTFKTAIAEGNKKLLIIGYSFRDDHINEILVDGVKNHGLKIVAIGNTPAADFAKRLALEYPSAVPLFGMISKYFTYSLKQIIAPGSNLWGIIEPSLR